MSVKVRSMMVTPLRLGHVAVAIVLLTAVAGAGPRQGASAPPRVEGASPRAPVATLRIPEGGGMPRAVVDVEGTLHVVYADRGGSRVDLFHVTREAGATGWSKPRQVNSRALSVTGLGPIDGAQLALGPDGRLHVVWMRSEPPAFFYTRSLADGSGFEPQRELPADEPGSVEAGPAVAADDGGNVYVFWHAGAFDDARRSVFLATSRDGGETFEPARRVSPASAGACACCGLAAAIDARGAVHVSYRGAGDNVRRGQRLLTSTDHGRTFADRLVQPWELGACPVSTTSLFAGPGGLTVAWETQGQVHFAGIDRLDAVRAPPGEARFRRKNPVVAVGPGGDTLLAWGDGPGFSFGGSLHWQVFDAAGRPVGESGGGTGTIIEGSTVAAVVQEGRFLVVFQSGSRR